MESFNVYLHCRVSCRYKILFCTWSDSIVSHVQTFRAITFLQYGWEQYENSIEFELRERDPGIRFLGYDLLIVDVIDSYRWAQCKTRLQEQGPSEHLLVPFGLLFLTH